MQRPAVNLLPSPIITVVNEIIFDVCLTVFRLGSIVFALNQCNIIEEIFMLPARIISGSLSLSTTNDMSFETYISNIYLVVSFYISLSFSVGF